MLELPINTVDLIWIKQSKVQFFYLSSWTIWYFIITFVAVCLSILLYMYWPRLLLLCENIVSLLVLHNILPQNLISSNNNFIFLQVSRMAQWAILAWGLSCSCSQILMGLQTSKMAYSLGLGLRLTAYCELVCSWVSGLPSLTTSGWSDFSHNGDITKTCSEVTGYNFCCFL